MDYRFGGIALKDVTSADEHIHACLDKTRGGLALHAAVNLNKCMRAFLVD